MKDIITKSKLIESYNRLGSYKKVAKEFGCSNVTITNYMKKFNIYTAPIKPLYNHNLFSDDTEDSFYLAGVWAADGNVRLVNRGYNLRLTVKDEEWLKLISKKLNFLNIKKIKNKKCKINNKTYNCANLFEVSLFSKKLFDDIKRFGIVPNKSLTYEIPKFILEHELCHHFLRGMVDGDGSFYHKKNHVEFSIVGTLNVCKSFKEVFEKNKIVSVFNKKIYHVNKNKNTYSLTYGGNSVVASIHNYLYQDATIFLKRKKDIAQQAKCNMKINRTKIGTITKPEIEQIKSSFKTIKDCSDHLNIDSRTFKKLLAKFEINTGQ